MTDFEKILNENPVGVFATQDGQGVKTRVFHMLYCEGGKAYFCTGNDKPVAAQMRANPNVSFCVWAKDFAPVVSANGPVVVVDDPVHRQRAIDTPGIKDIYGGLHNPAFEVFYIDIMQVQTYNYENHDTELIEM